MATMQPDLEKLTKELYEAFNAHDLDRFISLHTEDASSENVATGAVISNRKDLRAYFANALAAIPDAKLELVSCFASGNKQCEEVILKGTHTGELQGIPATGKSFSVREVFIREFREGKTCRVTAYSDNATLLRQLGVLPPPPQK